MFRLTFVRGSPKRWPEAPLSSSIGIEFQKGKMLLIYKKD
jgi:hypothetical protein